MAARTNVFHNPKQSFAGNMGKPSVGATLICINDAAIPTKAGTWDLHCTSDKALVNLTVVRIEDPGFSKVPYANVNNKTVMGENPKPLAEFRRVINEAGSTVLDPTTLDCYGFLLKKGKPKDKGRRMDGTDETINDGKAVSYSIKVGDVHRFYLNKQSTTGGSDREKRENLLPSDVDVIPAFSRLIVRVTYKGWDKYKEGDIDANGDEVQTRDLSACYRGYGCGITEIRLAAGSLYSDKDSIPLVFPLSAEDMKIRQQARSDGDYAIRQVFQTENVPFRVASVSRSAYTAYDPTNRMFKVLEWSTTGGGDAIDVPAEVMLRACNAPWPGGSGVAPPAASVQAASDLLDLAIAAGAVSFVCATNSYRGRNEALSCITGFPLICTGTLLANVDSANLICALDASDTDFVRFETGIVIEGDTISAKVYCKPIGPLEGEPVPLYDMPLLCRGISTDSAYQIEFINAITGAVGWSGYFNLGDAPMNPSGAGANAMGGASNAVSFSRKRWGGDLSAAVASDAVDGKKKSKAK